MVTGGCSRAVFSGAILLPAAEVVFQDGKLARGVTVVSETDTQIVLLMREGHVQSVQANPLDNLLGAILGLFSGAILGCSLLLIVSVELPVLMAGFDRQKLPLPADQLPFGVFRMVERNVAGIPTQSLSRTPPCRNFLPANSTNPSAKVGQIILRGGTNAEVTEYTPNRIFVGGRMAYAFDEEASELVATPVIESLVYEPGLQ